MQKPADNTAKVGTGIFGGQECRGSFVPCHALSLGRSADLRSGTGIAARRFSPGRRPALLARGFTVVELLVVISIMGIIAALVVGLSSMASGKRDKANVSNQLAQLVTAIESYKSKVGYYPPDNPAGPGTNQLYYELSGSVYLPASTSFQDRDGKILPATTIASYFGVNGFVNADEAVRPLVPNFIKTFKTNQWAALNQAAVLGSGATPIYVLKVPVKGPNGALITWNYNSTSPTNNPGRFDLWADFPVGGTNLVRISNWNRQPILLN